MFKNFLKPFLIKKISQNFSKRCFGKIKATVCPTPLPPMNVTIAGATTDVGRTTALLLKQSSLIKNIYLYDRDETEEIACYLNQINTSTRVIASTGIETLKDTLFNSRIVVICGGQQTFPCDTEDRLFYQNADFVRQIVMYCAEFNPRISIAIVTPPVTYLVPMAVEECKKADVFNHKKIFGVVTPSVSRANSLAADYMKLTADNVKCMVVGGGHRRGCIPVLSQLVSSNSVQAKYREKLWRDIAEAEEDVVYEKSEENCRRGAYLGIAHGAVRFVNSLARSLHGTPDVQECVFVKQEKPLKLLCRYLTTPVTLDKNGARESHMPKLSELEMFRLKDVIERVQRNALLGEFYITGDDFVIQRRKDTKRRLEFEKMKREIGVMQPGGQRPDLVCGPPKTLADDERECRSQSALVDRRSN